MKLGIMQSWSARWKVKLGNALAEIAELLARAQERAGNYWMLEQPATSLMWLYAPIAKLLTGDFTYFVTTDVCAMAEANLYSWQFPGIAYAEAEV